MSVHLKEGLPPFGKVGRPGNWKMVQLSQEPLSRKQLETIVRELVSEASRLTPRTKIEIRRPHSLIIQHKEYRIVVVFPPVSERLEITATRPVGRKRIEDYGLDPKVLERLEKSAEGILIAGAPGAGKTTFAQALAEFYLSRGKVVKTLESPRDMGVEAAELEEAARVVVDRLNAALRGVPEETRGANPDGTTRFLRPRPGAARMYPETDLPPIKVTFELLKRAEEVAKVSLEGKIAELTSM